MESHPQTIRDRCENKKKSSKGKEGGNGENAAKDWPYCIIKMKTKEGRGRRNGECARTRLPKKREETKKRSRDKKSVLEKGEKGGWGKTCKQMQKKKGVAMQ